MEESKKTRVTFKSFYNKVRNNFINNDDTSTKEKILEDQNFLNLYLSLLIYRQTGKAIFFTSETYYNRLKSYIYDTSIDSVLLLYAQNKLELKQVSDETMKR